MSQLETICRHSWKSTDMIKLVTSRFDIRTSLLVLLYVTNTDIGGNVMQIQVHTFLLFHHLAHSTFSDVCPSHDQKNTGWRACPTSPPPLPRCCWTLQTGLRLWRPELLSWQSRRLTWRWWGWGCGWGRAARKACVQEAASYSGHVCPGRAQTGRCMPPGPTGSTVLDYYSNIKRHMEIFCCVRYENENKGSNVHGFVLMLIFKIFEGNVL